ncbi:MAG: hypothetical protein WCF23_19690 [Candidatus Nitrosopolaris sp.]
MSQVRGSFRPPGPHSQKEIVVSILLTKTDYTTNFREGNESMTHLTSLQREGII